MNIGRTLVVDVEGRREPTDSLGRGGGEVNLDKPRGYVLIVGPDGSGKTAVLHKLHSMAVASTVPVVQVFRRPGLVPGGPSYGYRTNRTGRRRGHALLASARLLLLLLDHWFGALGPWRKASKEGLLLVQRGWFDMVVDPNRYCLPKTAAIFAAALGRFVPRPDLVVLLCGNPSEIRARKAELTVEEISRQLAAWHEYLPRCGRRHLEIDATLQNPDQLAGLIWDALRREGC